MSDPSQANEGNTGSAAFLAELQARHLLHQCTDREGLAAHLDGALERGVAGGVKLYNGFDPTADSLTIGHLVPIMLLRRFREAGHTPIVLQGGATGLIGDPSGKEAERGLRTRGEVEANIAAQRPIFERLLGEGVRIVNNDDWFREMDAYTFLRDIGKHFSVSQMMARDSVRNRLEREQGISYTEFSYMLLQAHDFLHLFREEGVTLQTAGADQWGNIVSGVDLIRRRVGTGDDDGDRGFGLTAPLLTKADGSKFGKTESGSVWLSGERPVSGEPGTSAYGYYQFWLNAGDAEVGKYLRIFTDRGLGEVEEIELAHAAEPHKREAQRVLARDATAMLHGEAAMENAERAAKALFSGDVKSLDAEMLAEVFAEVPATGHELSVLDGGGLDAAELLARTSLVSSKSEARKQLKQNAVSVNGEKIGEGALLTREHLLDGGVLLLRRGKKAWHMCRFG